MDLSTAIIGHTKFTNAMLSNSKFLGAFLYNVDFDGVNLENSVFDNSVIIHSDIKNAKIKKESETQSTRRTVITGNKPVHIYPETSDAKAEILNLQKLAGMK